MQKKVRINYIRNVKYCKKTRKYSPFLTMSYKLLCEKRHDFSNLPLPQELQYAQLDCVTVNRGSRKPLSFIHSRILLIYAKHVSLLFVVNEFSPEISRFFSTPSRAPVGAILPCLTVSSPRRDVPFIASRESVSREFIGKTTTSMEFSGPDDERAEVNILGREGCGRRDGK